MSSHHPRTCEEVTISTDLVHSIVSKNVTAKSIHEIHVESAKNGGWSQRVPEAGCQMKFKLNFGVTQGSI